MNFQAKQQTQISPRIEDVAKAKSDTLIIFAGFCQAL